MSLQDTDFPYSLKILVTSYDKFFLFYSYLFYGCYVFFFPLRLRSAILCSDCSKIHLSCLLLCLTFISVTLFPLEINISFWSLGFWRWCVLFEIPLFFCLTSMCSEICMTVFWKLLLEYFVFNNLTSIRVILQWTAVLEAASLKTVIDLSPKRSGLNFNAYVGKSRKILGIQTLYSLCYYFCRP